MKSKKWPPHQNYLSKLRHNHKTISKYPSCHFTTDAMKFVNFRVFARQRDEKIDSPVSCNKTEQLKPQVHLLNFNFDSIVRNMVVKF